MVITIKRKVFVDCYHMVQKIRPELKQMLAQSLSVAEKQLHEVIGTFWMKKERVRYDFKCKFFPTADARIQFLKNQFFSFELLEDRYQLLWFNGKTTSQFAIEELQTEQSKIQIVRSQVGSMLILDPQGKVHLQADSDALWWRFWLPSWFCLSRFAKPKKF